MISDLKEYKRKMLKINNSEKPKKIPSSQKVNGF
jgi:hypothetical protein